MSKKFSVRAINYSGGTGGVAHTYEVDFEPGHGKVVTDPDGVKCGTEIFVDGVCHTIYETEKYDDRGQMVVEIEDLRIPRNAKRLR